MHPHEYALGVVNKDDLKIDEYRSRGPGGAGGWALRITHLPSGTVVVAEGEIGGDEDPAPKIATARGKLIEEIDARLRDA
jgi:protein subunit release factor A